MLCRAMAGVLGGVALAPSMAVVRLSETNASNDPGAVSSTTSVAVSPADPRVIVAGSNYMDADAAMPAYVSRDRGATFARSFLPRTLGGTVYRSTVHPSVAFSRNGTAFYGFMMAPSDTENHRPAVCILRPGQTTWQGPFPVSPVVGDDDKPYIAVDASASSPRAGAVYMAWNRNNPNGTQNILLARSSDGQTWAGPARVDDANASGYAIYAAPATGPNGEVYVAWNDYATPNGGFLKFDRSLDGGATFGADVTASDLRLNLAPDPDEPTSVYAIPAQPSRGIAASPSLGVDVTSGPRRGWIYLAYCDRAPGKGHDDVDIFVRRSTNGGVTWSAPVRVNDDASTSSQFWPWLSVDPVDGALHVTWYDAREDPANRKVHVYMARSLNGGQSFEANIKVSSAPSDQGSGMADPVGNDYGDYMGVAAFGGQVTPVWTDGRAGYNQIYAATLIHAPEAPSSAGVIMCNVSVPVGAAVASRALTLRATVSGPSSVLAPEWEVKPAGTPFDGAGLVRGAGVAFQGAPVPVTLSLANLSNGAYHWRVRAVRGDGLGEPGPWLSYGGNADPATDFTVGGITYRITDAARALRVAAGLVSPTVDDMLRLSVTVGATGAKGCDGAVTLGDAARVARAAAGRETIP